MHILLTDVLTCPRCGPEHGLILVAERMAARRVVSGVLGCANCREQYRVVNGRVELSADAAPVEGGAGNDPDTGTDRGGASAAAGDALRLGALLGVTHGPGFVLLAGPAAGVAAALAGLIEDIEVIAAPEPEERGVPLADGVNEIVLSPGAERLPLASGKMRGVVLAGAGADVLLEEAVRVLSPVGRLVLDPAPPDAAARLERLRMRVLAHEAGTLVASRA